MIAQKILIALLGIFALVFLGFQAFGLEFEAAGIRVLLLLLLIGLYCNRSSKGSFLYLVFLVFFSIAEILNFVNWLSAPVPIDKIDYLYIIGNSLYILSYLILIIQTLLSFNLVEVFRKYIFHILVLILLDILSVVVVTNTIMDVMPHYAYYLEFIYNAVIMILLNVALINYLHKDDKRSFTLLVGSIFIFFSEVIQTAYFYISEISFLNVISSLFFVCAFVSFYLHSILANRERKDSILSDLMA